MDFSEQHIFAAGNRYKVKRSFMSGASTFIAGEVIVFEADGYSFYDNSFTYEFYSKRDREKKIWWLHESKPANSWEELFEPLDKLSH